MRLLEVIETQKNKKLNEQAGVADVALSRGDIIEYRGQRYKWLGQQFVTVAADGTEGRAGGVPREMQQTLRNQFSSGTRLPLNGEYHINELRGKHILTTPDGKRYEFDSARDAETAQRDFERRPGRAARTYSQRELRRWTGARIYTEGELEDALRNRGFFTRLSPWVSKLFSVFRILGFPLTLYLSSAAVYDDIQNDPDLDSAEKERLSNIYAGLFYSQIIAVMFTILKTAALVTRFVSLIRWALRGSALAAGGTVVGAVPAFIVWILGEVAIGIAVWYITKPSTQRALADYIAGTISAEMFEGIGFGVEGAAAFLDDVTGGLVGSDNLRRSLGWTDDAPRNAEEAGDYYSSSEWGKILFAEMFKTPEPIEVPFISKPERERLMRQRLQLTEESLTPLTVPADTDQVPQTDSETTTPTPPANPAAARGATAPGDMGDGTRGTPSTTRSGTTGWEDLSQQDYQDMAASGNFGG